MTPVQTGLRKVRNCAKRDFEMNMIMVISQLFKDINDWIDISYD